MNRSVPGYHLDGSEIAKIVQVFELDASRTEELSRLLNGVTGCLAYQDAFSRLIARIGPRSRTRERLQRLQAALSETVNALRGLDLMSICLLKMVLDNRISTSEKNRLARTFLKNPLLFDLSQSDTGHELSCGGLFALLHELPDEHRKMLGEGTHPSVLGLIESIRKPVELLLKFERSIGSGAPGKRDRNLVIHYLAVGFERIFGQPPTSTPRGKFVLLCELALGAIGLPTAGVENAVARILRQRKNRLVEDDVSPQEEAEIYERLRRGAG